MEDFIKLKTEELLAKGAEACLAYLIDLGILDLNGNYPEFNQEEFDKSNNPYNYERMGIVGKVL